MYMMCYQVSAHMITTSASMLSCCASLLCIILLLIKLLGSAIQGIVYSSLSTAYLQEQITSIPVGCWIVADPADSQDGSWGSRPWLVSKSAHFGPTNGPVFRFLGGSGGGSRGPICPVFEPYYTQHTIPIRARAYNDCVEHHVLLKTRSSGGPGYPLIERVLGLQMTHMYTR